MVASLVVLIVLVKGAEVSRKSKLSMFDLEGSEAALMTTGLRATRSCIDAGGVGPVLAWG